MEDNGYALELAAAIQTGMATNRFSTTSKVRLIEASSPDSISDEGELDEENLSKKLENIAREDASSSIRARNIFIPWAVHDQQFAITPPSLVRICATIGVPALFIEGLFVLDYATRPGDGLFFYRAENGAYVKIDIFSRLLSPGGGRAYIFTEYNVARKLTTNLFFNIQPDQTCLSQKNPRSTRRSSIEEPLANHVHIAKQTLEKLNRDGSNLRAHLLQDENGQFMNGNPKDKTQKLHWLAQQLHIGVENLIDFEEQMKFLTDASEKIRLAIKPTLVPGAPREADMLSYLLSKGRHSKRWMSNYRDRANIRINLAFHLSTQVDNDTNLRIATDTATIARDAQRDSSSMITIAAVTMFFLPGTFISAVFSMTFFNFQEDDTGNQQFQVSNKWWYFLAFTIPLTSVVFLVWIAWQKWRFRSQAEEDKKIREKGTI